METSERPKGFKAPEGGWGYVIVASIVIMNCSSLIPLMMFSLLYGAHLATMGDEASQTALTLQVALGLISFTGCFVGLITTKLSFRTTGFIGASLFCLGAFGEHFSNSTVSLIIFTAVFKGAGFGLMQILSMSLLNMYFDKKLNVAMGILHIFISIGTIAAAPLTAFLMKHIGVSSTSWLYSGLSLLNFPAMATFRSPTKSSDVPVELQSGITEQNISPEIGPPVKVPLLRMNEKLNNDKTTNVWIRIKTLIMDKFGLRLFNTFKFWNTTIGLSVAITTDLIFFALLRVFYISLHYESEDISYILMIYFISDIVGRISFSILSGFWTFKNRYSFLIANVLANILRTMFFLRDDYLWTLLIVVSVGWLKAFIETSIPLVIAEEYKTNFPQAYSMYHIIFGCTSMISSPLTSFIKTYVGDDAMVVYVYCGINLIFCSIWLIEILQGKIWKWFCSKGEDC